MMRTGVLAEWLAREGHDVTWWSSTFDHTHKRQRFRRTTVAEPHERLRIVHLWSPGYRRNVSMRRLASHFQLAGWFLLHARSRLRPDVVFASMPSIEVAAAAGWWAKRRGIPFVVEVRDPYPDLYLEAFPPSLRALATRALAPFRGMTSRTLSSADAVIGISESFLDWALRLSGRARVSLDEVIPLGLPEPPQRAAGTAAVRPYSAWFVGAFNRIIDLGTVLEAAKLLEAKGSPVHFVLSGAGEMGERWRSIAAGSSNVKFTGWVDGSAFAALQAEAWVGLAPYVVGTEPGFRNKFFDYFAAGLPVVSSIDGETAATIDAHGIGLTYRSGDAEMLADILDDLAKAPDRHREMALAAKRYFEERMEADRAPEQIADLLGRVVRR